MPAVSFFAIGTVTELTAQRQQVAPGALRGAENAERRETTMRSQGKFLLGATIILIGFTLVSAWPGRVRGSCSRRDADRVVTLEGKVMEMPTEGRMALFQADGKTYLLHMGPRWFWRDHGYALAERDRLQVTGRVSGDDPGSLNLFPHTITRNGEIFTLAGPDGRPSWAGPGRRMHGRGGGGFCGRERGATGRDSSWGRGVSGPRRG